MLEVLFLGTGASLPSRDRSPPCIAVRSNSDIVLLDCGEGSQRQMMVSPMSFMKIKGIFITHMHGDHVFGLPGLLQTMGMSGRKDPLIVCGPEGFRDALAAMMHFCPGEIPYVLDIRELRDGDVVDMGLTEVYCFETLHNMPSLGYSLKEKDQKGKFDKEKAVKLGLRPSDYSRLQEGQSVEGVTPDMVIGPSRPGLRLVYSGDTLPCDKVREFSSDADLLIHEATYCQNETDLASKYFHTTAKQAAEIAKGSRCKNLILVHISNRYDDRSIVETEARGTFANSYVADDLQMYMLTKEGLRSV